MTEFTIHYSDFGHLRDKCWKRSPRATFKCHAGFEGCVTLHDKTTLGCHPYNLAVEKNQGMYYHVTQFGTVLRTDFEVEDTSENRQYLVVINCDSSERAIALWWSRCVQRLNSLIH